MRGAISNCDRLTGIRGATSPISVAICLSCSGFGMPTAGTRQGFRLSFDQFFDTCACRNAVKQDDDLTRCVYPLRQASDHVARDRRGGSVWKSVAWLWQTADTTDRANGQRVLEAGGERTPTFAPRRVISALVDTVVP